MTIRRATSSESETEQLAAELAQRLRDGDIVTLEGPLGAGKTCFVRGLARGLGIDPKQVSSPTFVISQEYVAESGELTLVHIDAYRLHGADDLESIGWDELVASPSVITAVEWPGRIAAALASMAPIEVTLEPASQFRRNITIQAHGEAALRLQSALD